MFALLAWDTVISPTPKITHSQITGEAQAHVNALRNLQASHDEALGSAQQVGALFSVYSHT